MDWILNVNEILKDDITKITNSLIPPGFEGDLRSIRDYNVSHRRMQDSLSRLVDTLGEQSAAEQGLSKVITTADKLRTADQHALYLLRDADARDGKGEVVGMLKVGRKHLFLYDSKQAVREVEPLCVLDFYVARGWQRRGWGKALFDHMLQDTQTSPHQLAVDGPSDKMESFLAKNYGMTGLVRQSNNFAISPHFFDALPAHQLLSKVGASTPALCAVGRHAAQHLHQLHSSVGNVIHGGAARAHLTGGGAARAHLTDGSEESSGSERVGAGGAAQTTWAARPRSLPALVPALAGAGSGRGTSPAPAPERAAGVDGAPAGVPSRRDSHHPDEGLLDVKFHHNRLW